MGEKKLLCPIPNAKERKHRPMYRGLLAYFPNALELVSNVSDVGNIQHNGPDAPLYWDKTKSSDEPDALLRHLKEYSEGKEFDDDGVPVLAKVCWRALAFLQREIDKERAAGTYVPPKIGKRTLLEFLGWRTIGNGRVTEGRWKVQCDCGKVFECGDYEVSRTWFKPCQSCCQSHPKPSRRKRPFEAQYNGLVHRTKHEVLLSYEEFVQLTDVKECHYCGAPINWPKDGYGKSSSPSNLDRKDNRLPYTKENVVVCCKKCNIGKNRFFTYDEWKQIGELIRQWYAKK
jgi:hypothetical protein